MRKRLFSLLLVFCLCASLCIPVFATDEENSCVAAIENEQYDTLFDALFFAENGQTVTLLADVEEDRCVVLSNITLDLNGHRITRNMDTPAAGDGTNELISITSGSSLTIRDDLGTGGISYTGAGATYAILNNGSLTVTSGSISCENIAIMSQGTQTVTTIDGGTIRGGEAAIAVNGGSVTVTGGTVQSGGDTIPAITAKNDASVSISGGTIIGEVEQSFYAPDYQAPTEPSDPYFYESIAQYRTAENYTAPTQDGKVFCGWYKDAAYSEYMTEEEANETTTGAYAKFVDQDVLSVGRQITSGTTSDSEKTDLRLVTTVDTRNYQTVGFAIQLDGKTTDKPFYAVYEKLYGKQGTELLTYEPTFFSPDSRYLLALRINNIPSESFSKPFTITPYWITPDGTRVEGVTSAFTISGTIEKQTNASS